MAIEPGAFHYTFWCHDQLLNFGKDISQDNFGRNSKDNSTQTKLVWVVVSDNLHSLEHFTYIFYSQF